MSSENDNVSKTIFESKFFSLILMLALLLMGALFIIVIHQFFGLEPALNVLMYIGIGSGGGIIFTFIILGIFSKQKASKGRNILLYMTAIILFLSLIIALILKFSLQDDLLSQWAFINTNSIGLGITTGIAVTYSVLTLASSKLVYGSPKDDEQEDKEEIDIDLAEES